MMCQMYRAKFKIPDTLFEGIQNFFMTKLMDFHGLSKDGSRESFCARKMTLFGKFHRLSWSALNVIKSCTIVVCICIRKLSQLNSISWWI